MPEKELTFEERQKLLKQKRSLAEKIYAAGFKTSGIKTIDEYNDKLKPGAGKGKEPKPWCLCHNRNPCPIDKELMR